MLLESVQSASAVCRSCQASPSVLPSCSAGSVVENDHQPTLPLSADRVHDSCELSNKRLLLLNRHIRLTQCPKHVSLEKSPRSSVAVDHVAVSESVGQWAGGRGSETSANSNPRRTLAS